MTKIIIKQIKSQIGCTPVQRATLKSLGLRKINSVREHDDNRVIQGMLDLVKHLVDIKSK